MNKKQRWLVRLGGLAYILLVYFTVPRYYYMALNVFLAYIPLEISFQLDRFKFKSVFLFWALVFSWLLFYPNIPYLFTDLLHIASLKPYTQFSGVLSRDSTLWYSFFVLISGVLVFGSLCSWNLDWMVRQVMTKLSVQYSTKMTYCVLVSSVIILASIGIYIGRFLRFHSIDLLLHLPTTIQAILHMWDKTASTLICFFAVFQAFLFGFYHFTQNLRKTS